MLKERRIKGFRYTNIDIDTLIKMMLGHAVRIVITDIPIDAEFRGITQDISKGEFYIWYEHPSYEPVALGAIGPIEVITFYQEPFV